jgi:hypothetical protein
MIYVEFISQHMLVSLLWCTCTSGVTGSVPAASQVEVTATELDAAHPEIAQVMYML